MKLELRRRPATDDAILGDLFVDGRRECFTLERAGVEIPLGRYRVIINRSKRFNRMLPLVLNVPGRDGIRIHPANFPEQLEGCIAPGQTIMQIGNAVGSSRKAMDELQSKIARAQASGFDVWLDVTEATGAEPLNA